jgi:RecA-family ATPase
LLAEDFVASAEFNGFVFDPANFPTGESEQSRKHSQEPPDKEFVRAALAVIPSDTYDDWVQIARALYHMMTGIRCLLIGPVSLPNMTQVNAWQKEAPTFTEITVATIFHKADEADPTWRQRYQDNKQKARIHATPYVFTAPSLLKPRQYIYKPGYVRKYTSMTIATTKVGKSSKSIVEALAMVTGKPLLGVLPFAPVRVWYWNGEDPQEESEKRVAGACKHYGITAADIGGRLFIDSGRDMPIKIAELGRNGTKVAIPTVKGVIEALNDNKIDVFIGDPFVSTHRVTENDNNAIQQVAEQWAHIADITNTALRYNHHTRKTNGEAVDFESQRGASSNFAAVRYAEVLNYMTGKEAEDAGLNPARRKFYFREDFESNLYPPSAENAVWYEKVSVDLENAADGYESDKIGVVAQWNYPQVDNSDITLVQQATILTALLERENWRADQQAADWVGRPIAGVLGLDLELKVSRERVNGIIEKLVAWGKLHSVTIKVNRADRKGYTAHPLQGGIPF